MTFRHEVIRDERTNATEDASYRWAYVFVSFGLLLITAYRAYALGESSWDLIALVVLGGVVSAAYQRAKQIPTRRWALVSGLAMVLAAVLAATIVALR